MQPLVFNHHSGTVASFIEGVCKRVLKVKKKSGINTESKYCVACSSENFK